MDLQQIPALTKYQRSIGWVSCLKPLLRPYGHGDIVVPSLHSPACFDDSLMTAETSNCALLSGPSSAVVKLQVMSLAKNRALPKCDVFSLVHHDMRH